jgi:hypothetical protein
VWYEVSSDPRSSDSRTMRSVDLRSVLWSAIERQRSFWQLFYDAMAYPESKVLQALGQAGQRLVSRPRLGYQRERRRWAGEVSARKLNALGIARLVLEGT